MCSLEVSALGLIYVYIKFSYQYCRLFFFSNIFIYVLHIRKPTKSINTFFLFSIIPKSKLFVMKQILQIDV